MNVIYLYGDQPIIALGLANVLMATGRFHLEHFSSGMPTLLARLETRVPAILLLDIRLDLMIAAVSDITRVAPACKLVLWVDTIPAGLAFQAMGLGVRGILRKGLPREVHVRCLEKICEGEYWFEKTVTDGSYRDSSVGLAALNSREEQVLALLSQGMRNKEMATALGISEGTVKTHLSRLFAKLGVRDRLELMIFGLKNLAKEK
jgi:two-component system, NarL family, nitrate/nitrite response regulator NarL